MSFFCLPLTVKLLKDEKQSENNPGSTQYASTRRGNTPWCCVD
jgi:hypothetical protein